MNTDKTVYVGIRIPQNVVIEAKKYVAERPGLTLSRLYEQSVTEFIRTHQDTQNAHDNH
jgi:hypothetical protein